MYRRGGVSEFRPKFRILSILVIIMLMRISFGRQAFIDGAASGTPRRVGSATSESLRVISKVRKEGSRYPSAAMGTFSRLGFSPVGTEEKGKAVRSMSAVGVEVCKLATKGVDSKLQALRTWMTDNKISAFIVPSDDPHLSEYTAECYGRRAFISGFTGSAGTAVITIAAAHLWTDGRYFLQAEQELSADWKLMKAGQTGVPTVESWLAEHIPAGSSVGLDPRVHSLEAGMSLEKALAAKKIMLRPLAPGDLHPVDEAWGKDRPPPPSAPLRIHPLEHAGTPATEKIATARSAMAAAGADVLVLCALDEVAYLLNVRGGDVAHCPVAMAYAVVTRDACTLYVDERKVTEEVGAYLANAGVTVRPYDEAVPDVASAAADESKKVWLDPSRSIFAMGAVVPLKQRVSLPSPLALAKAIKNDAELQGMRAAHVRDGAALVEFLHWLEKEVKSGRKVSEVEIDLVLTARRAARPGFLDLSFPTIAGANGNGAIIHYRAEPETAGAVDSNAMLLLDSGAQYVDGTTDCTRTMHFGEMASPMQSEAYTRVLKGNIAIDTTVFPKGTPGAAIDAFARRALWAAGLDYAHGTGHGVGAALNVHEGPHSISPRFTNLTPLQPGMIVSNEPGFYAAGKFGVRIENLLTVEKTGLENKALGREFYAFKPLTLVPIQKEPLLDVSLMTHAELDWIDAYHARVWEEVGPHVDEKSGAREWLKHATAPINRA